MDLATIVGLALGFGALIGGFMIEGGSIGGLLNPSAAIIVIGGTVGAALVSFPLSVIATAPKAAMKAVFDTAEDAVALLQTFGGLADRARREGLLSLEQAASTLEDPFLRKGILLVVDGMDPETIETILETEIEAMEQRHARFYAVFEAMGGFSPTMGIIGTVMGLITVLSHLDKPGELGGAIAVAFVATLYGVATANVLYLPLANKLKRKSRDEAHLRRVMLAGILSIQAGDNPRIVREKLEAFLPASPQAKQEDVPAPAPGRGQEGELTGVATGT